MLIIQNIIIIVISKLIPGIECIIIILYQHFFQISCWQIVELVSLFSTPIHPEKILPLLLLNQVPSYSQFDLFNHVHLLVDGTRCLSFFYHMSGVNINALNVYMLIGTSTELIWTRYGDQGTEWHMANITIAYFQGDQVLYIDDLFASIEMAVQYYLVNSFCFAS